MRMIKTITAASFAVLLSSAALAATASAIKDANDGAPVMLKGTVEDFNNEHSFTLRDSSGSVKIDLTNTKSMVLKNGEAVEVNGSVKKGMIENTVIASSVSEDKNIGQQVGEAIDSVTGQDEPSNAKQVNVQSLPEKGLVKVQGTVDSVSNEKKFTLKDSTGSVDVALKADQGAALKKGSGVTVIGYVNKGLLGKSIDATKVEVRQ